MPEFKKPVDPDNDFNQTLGPYKYPDGSTYFGQYDHGKRQGFGVSISADGEKYIGQWDRDAKEGLARVIEKSGTVYEGEIVRGQYHGKGKMIDSNAGVVWEGTFKQGILEGIAKEEIPMKYTYVGNFIDFKKTGKGKVTYQDGSTYEGEFFEDN